MPPPANSSGHGDQTWDLFDKLCESEPAGQAAFLSDLAKAEPNRAKRLGDLLAGDRVNKEDGPLFRTQTAKHFPSAGPVSLGELLPPVDEAYDTKQILYLRLRLATGIGVLVLVCFLGKNLFDGHYKTAPGWLLYSHVASASVVCLVFLWLAGRRPRGETQLRRIEGIVLAAAVLFIAVYQLYLFTLCRPFLVPADRLSVMEEDYVDVVNEAAIFRWSFIIVGYGIFIPNKPWRFWAVSVGLALLPVGLTASFGLQTDARERVLDLMLEMAIWLAGAVGISFAGTRMIARYGRQIEEARRVGAYNLERHLKSGGMGHVFQATHCQMLQPTAIKFLTYAVPERFHDEAVRMARLRHPHIVQIYNCGEHRGTPYLVMELLRGRTLQELVGLTGPLPAGRVVYLLLQVCSALTYLHHFGYVHHDVKPSNLFVCEEYGGKADWVKLLDFGLTRPPSGPEVIEPARAGAFWGTPGYVPPDLMPPSLGPADARTDVFGLGVTAYFLLQGKAPFDRGTLLPTLFAVRNYDPPPPKGQDAEPIADVAAVVLRCLEKDPKRRYSSMSELEKDLQACQCAHVWDSARARQWWEKHRLDPSIATESVSRG
jgi:eukaryotic-like serine/threonine-protein kinase